MSTTQPNALRLAHIFDHPLPPEWPDMVAAAAELRRQHARIAELEARVQELGQMARDVNSRRVVELEAQLEAIKAANAGSEAVANNRPSLESVFRGLSARAYCNYIEQMRRDVCLGWEHKAGHGKFGEAELKGHTMAGEQLGRYKAFAEAANALRGSDAPLTHPSPPEGMAGWMPIETAPKNKTNVILLRQACGSVANGFWLAEAYAGNGSWIWPYVHKNPTHWMPAPPIASEAKGAGHA